MKLNPDCIRDILLYVEENTGYGTYADVEKMLNALDYENETIMYHAKQCEQSGMFTEVRWYLGGYSGTIVDLSPKAHEFIANIRSENNWCKTKEKARAVGSFSINVLAQIAANYISSLIS